MEQGLIFDIERFSTADGPGIRTSVFFKGCNLNCFWCHNPESLRRQPQLEYCAEDCLGCGSCVVACPSGGHTMTAEGHRYFPEKCQNCMKCVEACPVSALKSIGVYHTVEECMAQIREDLPFYRRSGGGVALSGGEVLMQPEFAAALLRQCRQEGIHTAVETNLCAPWQVLEQLLPSLDLVMADIKHMNTERHRQGTGRENDQILANILRLDRLGIPLIIRTPVIPGYNDSLENIAQTAAFLQSVRNLRYYELLRYNPMGNDKRRRLGYPVPELPVPDQSHMRSLARMAGICGKPVWVDGKHYVN